MCSSVCKHAGAVLTAKQMPFPPAWEKAVNKNTVSLYAGTEESEAV